MTPRNDAGVTMVELLLGISITSLLAVVIAAAFTAGVRATDEANVRLAGSQGAQITTSFFPADVRSSATITLGTTPCTGATPTVAELNWVDVTSGGVSVAKQATYTCTVSGPRRDLVRQYAEDGVTVGQVVIAYDVVTAAVSCSPTCATPTAATIAVSESGGFTFTVSGVRRFA